MEDQKYEFFVEFLEKIKSSKTITALQSTNGDHEKMGQPIK